MSFCSGNGKVAAFGVPLLLFVAVVLSLAVERTSRADSSGIWRHHERQAPTREIRGLAVLPDGRIVAGTEGSLHTFNGERWEKQVYSPALLANHALFFRDSGGRLYFLDNDRLVTWKDGEVTRHDTIELSEPICAAEAPDGTVYFGSYQVGDGGVYVFDGERTTRIYEPRVRSLAVDADGNLWATVLPAGATGLRLMMRSNGTWTDRTQEVSSLFPIINNNLMVQSAPDGAMWVMNEGSYGVLRNGSWTLRKSPGGGSPVALQIDPSGRVWGYGYGVLYRLNDAGSWTVIRTGKSLLSHRPGFVAWATDGTVYSFDAEIVYRLVGNTWQAVESLIDLGSDLVTTVTYMDDGKLLCGHGVRGRDYTLSERRGISIFDPVTSTWTNIRKTGPNQSLDNVFLTETAPGGEVFIYSDSGYFFFNGTVFDPVDSLDIILVNLRKLDTTDVQWDQNGKMWLTTGLGLWSYNDPELKWYHTPLDLNPSGGVYNLCMDDEEMFYMQAIHGRVLATDRSEWQDWIHEDTASLNDIDVQPDGTLWGALVGKLARWDITTQSWVTAVDFPDSNRLVQIDPQGRIWSSSYGKTGYLENEVFHAIPELSGIAANAIAFSDDDYGRIAVNAFDRKRTEYSGIYEYDPNPVSVEEPDRPVPFLTATAYPNPFNPAVTIQFELPAAGRARIEVFNITGQRVKTIVDQSFPAGVNRVRWDSTLDSGSRASSGVYFYRIQAGPQTRTGKMLLLR